MLKTNSYSYFNTHSGLMSIGLRHECLRTVWGAIDLPYSTRVKQLSICPRVIHIKSCIQRRKRGLNWPKQIFSQMTNYISEYIADYSYKQMRNTNFRITSLHFLIQFNQPFRILKKICS